MEKQQKSLKYTDKAKYILASSITESKTANMSITVQNFKILAWEVNVYQVL